MPVTGDISAVAGGNQMYTAPQESTGMAQSDFLQLLITQLRHQDPMEPQESQEFAAQLAQFSSLEQLQNISGTLNESVEADLMLTQTINNTMAATMIGKDIKAFGNNIQLEPGVDAQVNFKTSAFADTVDITIRDQAGQVVRVINMQAVSKGDQQLTWDGMTDDGRSLPAGTYNFSVEATNANGTEIPSVPVMIGIIESVRYSNAGAIFVVNGEEIPFSSVLELGDF